MNLVPCAICNRTANFAHSHIYVPQILNRKKRKKKTMELDIIRQKTNN